MGPPKLSVPYSDHSPSPASRQTRFLLSESQYCNLQFRQWGRAVGGISAVKTATRQRIGKSGGVWRLSWQDGKTWASVWLDADGADLTSKKSHILV